MLQSNARMQTATMFAALLILAGMALALYGLVDHLARRLVRWQPDKL
jgi:putative hydroxymethylpyrimidine transport system permease protein